MAADAWKTYDAFWEDVLAGNVDMDADTFKVSFHTSTYTPSQTADAVYADATNELTTANGYTNGGITITNPAVSGPSSNTTRWDCDDVSETASGGDLVFRTAVIRDTTFDTLVAYSVIDNTPADYTISDGDTLTIQMNASGVFEVSNA